jgi:hypothetical protein
MAGRLPNGGDYLVNEVPPHISELDNAVDDDSSEEDEFVPCPDIEEQTRVLGRPVRRAYCFGCRYIGRNAPAKIPDERLQAINEMMAEGIGHSDPVALAKEVAERFAELREEINTHRRPGTEPIPEWNAASILAHWCHHNTDPEIQQWLHLMRLQKTITLIEEQSLVKRNKRTRKKYVDKEQFSIMRDSMRMWYTIAAKDPRKLHGYDEGAYIKSKSNGRLNASTQPVFNFFKKRRRR